MAKVKRALIHFSGTLGGITFVQGRYGAHVRAARGTHKPATINDSLEHQVSLNTIVARPAQLLLNFLKQYAPGFKKSDLWQDMMSLMRKRDSTDALQLLQTLEGMEVNPQYALHHALHSARLEVQVLKGVMTLTLTHHGQPYFKVPGDPDCYFTEIQVLFADEDLQLLETATINTGWIPLQQSNLRHETSFEVPVTAMYYVALVAVQAGRDGVPIEDKRAMGMAVMGVGRVE